MTIEQYIAASIDLGSNSFRLLVAAFTSGTMNVLEKKLVTVRLGQGLEQNNRLHQQAMERGLDVLRSFRKVLDMHRVQSIRICGTEALRQAVNSQNFLQAAKKILQCEIEIISGVEEARLSLNGALSGGVGLSGPILLADVGGGSTELIHSSTLTGPARVATIGLGAINLTEKFLVEPAYDITAMDMLLTEKISATLNGLNISEKHQPIEIIGSGGTATSLAALDLDLNTYEESLVHGHTVHERSMEQLWQRLIALPSPERNRIPCLGEGRGEILPAGLRVYLTLLKLLKHDRIRVSDTGLLEGLLLSTIPSGQLPYGSVVISP